MNILLSILLCLGIAWPNIAIAEAISRSDLRISYDKIQSISILPREIKRVINFQKKLQDISEYTFIPQELKRHKFQTVLRVKYQNGNSSIHNAEMRLSGRAKDHILSHEKKIISSVNIKLETGNILGITKFKLKLKSKDFIKNEILMGLIMERLGAINPYRQAVKVKLLDVNYMAMFEQEIDKILLEDSGLRESSIIRVNQEFMWDTAYIQNSNNCQKKEGVDHELFLKLYDMQSTINKKHLHDIYCKKFQKIFPNGISYQIVNQKWLKGYNSISIAATSINLLSSINNDYHSDPITTPFRESNRLLSFFNEHSWHAAEPINVNLYFDPIRHRFIPIYTDGSPDLSGNCSSEKELILATISICAR